MKNKLQFIEGIRGLAALIVIFQHFVLMFYPALYTGDPAKAHISGHKLEHTFATTPLNIFYNGNFAVCLFFVLSGFVLSYKYFKTNDVKVLLEYSIKRYFRLLVPVAFSIFFVITVTAIFKPDLVALEKHTKAGEWLTGLFSEKPSVIDLIYNVFIDVFFSGNNKYNPVLWTMGIEFLGSLMLFAGLLMLHFVKKKEMFLTVIIIFLVLSKNYFYSAFFAGAFICRLFIANNEIETQPKYILNCILFIAGIYFGSYPTAWQFLSDSVYAPLLIFKTDLMNLSLVTGSVLLIYFVAKSKKAQAIFSIGIFRFLGKISFSGYLIHLVILTTFSNALFMYFVARFSYNLAFILTAGISLLLIFSVSWLVFKLVDEKSIKFSNNVTSRISDYLIK